METVETLNREALTIPYKAKLILVKDETSKAKANDFFLIIKGLRKKIAETFDPMEEAAREAKRKAEDSRKQIVLQREKIEEPLKLAESHISGQIVRYNQEQERIQREEAERKRQEEIRLEMERRKREEEAKMAQAAALEQAGAKDEADQMMAEALQEVEAPLDIPIPETKKVELKGAAIRTTWEAQVFDVKALCRAISAGAVAENLVVPNFTALNQMARALQENMKIPGVKAISKTTMAATGR